MAKKDSANPFAATANKQQAEQEATAEANQTDGGAGETRVKLTLALSASDKVKLKTVAVKRGITVAKLVHEWIETLD